MTRIHAHGRWLGRVEAARAERQRRPAEDEGSFDLPALHRSLAAKRQAIPILVAFARELAGMPADEDAAAVAPEQPPPPAECVTPAEPLPGAIASPAARKWTKTHRPGPLDILTWDEAMQVPWVEGEEAYDRGGEED